MRLILLLFMLVSVLAETRFSINIYTQSSTQDYIRIMRDTIILHTIYVKKSNRDQNALTINWDTTDAQLDFVVNTGGTGDGTYDFQINNYRDIQIYFNDATNGWKTLGITTDFVLNTIGYNKFQTGEYAHFVKPTILSSGFVQGKWVAPVYAQGTMVLNDNGLGSCSLSCEINRIDTGSHPPFHTVISSTTIESGCSGKTPSFFTIPSPNFPYINTVYCGFNETTVTGTGNVYITNDAASYMDIVYTSFISSPPVLNLYIQLPSSSTPYQFIIHNISSVDPPKPGPTQGCYDQFGVYAYRQGICP